MLIAGQVYAAAYGGKKIHKATSGWVSTVQCGPLNSLKLASPIQCAYCQ
jgi:hypothetical protein